MGQRRPRYPRYKMTDCADSLPSQLYSLQPQETLQRACPSLVSTNMQHEAAGPVSFQMSWDLYERNSTLHLARTHQVGNRSIHQQITEELNCLFHLPFSARKNAPFRLRPHNGEGTAANTEFTRVI